MLDIYRFEGGVYLVVAFVVLAVKLFAFISALTFSARAYDAANKLNKPAWTIILGLGVAVQLLLIASPIGFPNLAFTIAALVYLADVRPALNGLRRR